jgi:hypothetical protein
MRLRRKQNRHKTLPRNLSRYAEFGRVEHDLAQPVVERDNLRVGRAWLVVSGEYLPPEATQHRLPIYVHYLDGNGHSLGWLAYEYGLQGGALRPQRLDVWSWFNRRPYSQALVRSYDEDEGRPIREIYTVDGAVKRRRDYNYDELGAPSLVYDQEYANDGSVLSATDMYPLHTGVWTERRVHRPKQSQVHHEERRLIMTEPRPISISGLGGLEYDLHLDAPLTRGA